MTAAQTIQIRLSECRQRLNTLLQTETALHRRAKRIGNADRRSVETRT